LPAPQGKGDRQMTRSIKREIADKIAGILIEYGFDEDEELIDDIIEAVLDIFGINEDDDGIMNKWEREDE
jgi:hypothetical protein